MRCLPASILEEFKSATNRIKGMRYDTSVACSPRSIKVGPPMEQYDYEGSGQSRLAKDFKGKSVQNRTFPSTFTILPKNCRPSRSLMIFAKNSLTVSLFAYLSQKTKSWSEPPRKPCFELPVRFSKPKPLPVPLHAGPRPARMRNGVKLSWVAKRKYSNTVLS